MPKAKDRNLTEVLSSWISLNDALKNAGEDYCIQLLEHEKKNKKRKQFLKRVHSRLNKVRADRERAELEAVAHV